MAEDGCQICEAPKHPMAYACTRCKHILDRVEIRRDASGEYRRVDRAARRRALEESWHDGAFHCYYTGVELVDDRSRHRDHRYLIFDHRSPGDESSVVVACALVNHMKTDLTEQQFRTMVSQLAEVFAGGVFDERAFPEGASP